MHRRRSSCVVATTSRRESYASAMRGIDSPTIEAVASVMSPRLMDSEKLNADHFYQHVRSPRRGLTMIKLIAIISCAFFCYLLFATVETQSEWKLVPSSHAPNCISDTSMPMAIPPSTTKKPAPDVQKVLSGNGKPLHYAIHTNELYDIDRAIRDVLQLVPDDAHIRELTKPITAGGEEKLHEVGLRVRMFKKYFDAWETLHVVTDGETAFVRDDIFRYIRDSKYISSLTDKTRAEALRQYETYHKFLSDMSTILFPWTAPYFSDHMTLHGHMYNAGRGIVISGNNDQALFILTAIQSFRTLGCGLPIEIMYLGEDDLSQENRERLEKMPNVATRDLKEMVDDQGWEMQGWSGKAFAAFMSSFREVILLDADVLFFDNPALLFEEPGYQDTGALFFRDRMIRPEQKKSFLRRILPAPISKHVTESTWWTGDSSQYQEAGVVVVDKWRHFLSVFLTARLNGPDRADSSTGRDSNSFWWGDKETWWIGFELAGDSDYDFHKGATGNMGVVSNIEAKSALKESSSREAGDGPIKMNILNTKEQQKETGSENASAELPDGMAMRATDSDQEGKAPEPLSEATDVPTTNPDQISPLSRRHLTRRDDWFNPSNSPSQRTQPLTTPYLLSIQPTHNYILCSPQLLHLTTSGRPMWFNGWIQQNKRDSSSEVSKFEVFVSSKMKDGGAAEWAMGGNNMACLKGDGLGVFEKKDMRTLEMIKGFARGNGALRHVKEG